MEQQTMTAWACQPKAEELIDKALEDAFRHNPYIEELDKHLQAIASARLFDFLDHVVILPTSETEDSLTHAGFSRIESTERSSVWAHLGAQLPLVIVEQANGSARTTAVGIKVDSIADFLMVRGFDRPIEGSFLASFRRSTISTQNGCSLVAVERRGALPLSPKECDAKYLHNYLLAKEKWQSRARGGEDESKAMDMTLKLVDELVQLTSKNLAAWIILEVERSYWQARNTAAQLQKNRQDRLGMGWANHDHHTFRSSRRQFQKLVMLFEKVGFYCRERFYAGKEAGWGAQVMENRDCGLILFLDVDLDPEEIEIDFAHMPLPELDNLGTIGLWCALHGDSILKAGMHHLEAQFLFEKLRDDLAHLGVRMMDPFSKFSFLMQAFTAGEIWLVEGSRIDKLLKEKKITPEQAEKFHSLGAVGSHLENLQRREGYKGFNQSNVSYIIKKTDPRSIER
jgi:hypothetical protein